MLAHVATPELHDHGSASHIAAETDKLRLRWHSAQRGNALPFYEDVALGSLGTVSDWLGVARLDTKDVFRFLRAGPGFELLVGHDMTERSCDDLAPNYRVALVDCLRRAINIRAPTSALARCVQDGSVATCEIMALPLKSRWGGDLVLTYLRQQSAAHDLVEAIYRSTSDGLIALAAIGDGSEDADFQVVSLNGAAAAMFGKPECEVCWRLLSGLVPKRGWETLRAQLSRALAAQKPHEFEYTIQRSDGAAVHLRVSVAPVGDLLGIALTDVTEMKLREDSVRLLFDNNPMPLLVFDKATLTIRRANDAMTRQCGRPAGHIIGSRWPELFAIEQRASLMVEPALAEQGRRSWRMVRADGATVEVEVYPNDLVFEGEDCVLATVHDVTEQRKAQSRVAFLAHHDDLTGLCNRLLFKSRLAEAVESCRVQGGALALHCIDLDFFKRVNDTYGHGAGDQVLRSVAYRIRRVIGPGDLVARLGGDEFAVIQTGLSSPAEAGLLAERLIQRLSAPYVLNGRQAILGASVGISVAPEDGFDPDILLHNADIALYRSKSDGRGLHHFFESGMDLKLQARRGLEADLRLALGKGEFELFYQPIVSTDSLAVTGYEALLRWFHPERGSVSPQDFIPVAEEIGIIDAVGEWVLRRACEEAANWPSRCTVAVNLSAVQFRRGSLPLTVASALQASGLDPSRLDLEITESVFLGESETNLAMLHQLRALGVSISLDDFGTGYSSLAYLSRFPVDKIKIDRSFIRDMGGNAHGLAIIRAVVSLGASLGIRTLAEGVETPEQFALLKQERCSELQGYLFGRPMPAANGPALPVEHAVGMVEAA